MKRVYLDQKDWIALSAEHHGKTNDPVVRDALTLALHAADNGLASFPLSASHYIETYRQRDPGRRQRLGSFMASLSRFHTIAGPPDLLDGELALALARRYGLPEPPGPRAFGIGAAHALGASELTYFTDPELEHAATVQLGGERVTELFEHALLTGPPERLPFGEISLPEDRWAERQLALEIETAAQLREWGHTRQRAHDLVLAQEVGDVLERLPAVAQMLGIGEEEFSISKETLTDLTLSLPSKGTICRMRMTGQEDPNFRWHRGDLNDLAGLGTAAAYCDIVVAENLWGSILQRHARHLKATVIRNLRELPELLLAS